MGNAIHDYYSSVQLKHKIFLSHCGFQKDFVDDLYVALVSAFQVPFYDKSLPLPRDRIFPGLVLNAASQCEVAVVVLTEKYLSSKWPMIELTALVKMWKSNTKLKILPVYYGLSIHDLNNERMQERWFEVWQEYGMEDPRINVEEFC
jgi:hypothetical protein